MFQKAEWADNWGTETWNKRDDNIDSWVFPEIEEPDFPMQEWVWLGVGKVVREEDGPTGKIRNQRWIKALMWILLSFEFNFD